MWHSWKYLCVWLFCGGCLFIFSCIACPMTSVFFLITKIFIFTYKCSMKMFLFNRIYSPNFIKIPEYLVWVESRQEGSDSIKYLNVKSNYNFWFFSEFGDNEDWINWNVNSVKLAVTREKASKCVRKNLGKEWMK